MLLVLLDSAHFVPCRTLRFSITLTRKLDFLFLQWSPVKKGWQQGHIVKTVLFRKNLLSHHRQYLWYKHAEALQEFTLRGVWAFSDRACFLPTSEETSSITSHKNEKFGVVSSFITDCFLKWSGGRRGETKVRSVIPQETTQKTSDFSC